MDVATFKNLLKRLSPLNATNEQCIQYIEAHPDSTNAFIETLLTEMNRSSLNARARILFFIEHCVGGVGKHTAPPLFNKQLGVNIENLIALGVPGHMYPACLANVQYAERCERSFVLARLIDTREFRNSGMHALTSEHVAAVTAIGEKLEESQKVYTNRDEVVRRIEEDRERMKRFKDHDQIKAIGTHSEFENEYRAAHLTHVDRARIGELYM